MSQNITVYTTNSCAYCGMVKRWLDTKGYAYQEINLEEQPERQQEVLEMSGSLSVPVTVVNAANGSKSIAVGYNIGKLASML
ncbi:glutaredoxin family protein [Candidatus Saccharibacteria bacterium CPR2]|nr:glutaredoxin family protein [Candidatus Saccharibacteria bacterium CPR2]